MAYTTIDDPSAYFQIALYTGTGSGQQVINDGNSDLQPDWIWVKRRDGLGYHQIIDSSRGGTKRLWANDTGAEGTQNNVASFDSDGFTAGNESDITPASTSQVAWQWKANGGTTSSNTDGSITSTVQANTTAGFSIVTYTGTGSAATVGHGLGAEPDMVIIKSRNNAVDWQVYLKSFGNDDTGLFLNTTDGATTATNYYNGGGTSSVFGVSNNTGVGANTYTYVAYCFRNIQGYSKIGSYTSNNNANGPFVYTGFKPAWVMTKISSGGGTNWRIYDNKRQGFNGDNDFLMPNSNAAENTSASEMDLLSNGFKLVTAEGDANFNTETVIYMAFAESPFVSSEGVPTTAR
jgi:hypothetical protein